jgi:hypothetical protein
MTELQSKLIELGFIDITGREYNYGKLFRSIVSVSASRDRLTSCEYLGVIQIIDHNGHAWVMSSALIDDPKFFGSLEQLDLRRDDSGFKCEKLFKYLRNIWH